MENQFELLEIPFNKEDFCATLEDQFTLVKIKQLINKADGTQLKEIAEKLAEISIQRQGMVRGLCMRLAKLDTALIAKKYEN